MGGNMNEETDADEIRRRIRAWIRHGEAVPADVTTYERWIVHQELRDIIAEAPPAEDAP